MTQPSRGVQLQLAWRGHRFEFAAIAIAGAAVAVGSVLATLRLLSFDIDQVCIDGWLALFPPPTACADQMGGWVEFNDAIAGPLLGLAVVIAFGMGLLVGVPVVADEIEAGTAEFSWAFASSRRRWLRQRIWPGAVVLVSAIAVVAVATALLSHTRSGGGLWVNAIEEIDRQGVGLAGRALFGFGAGVALGAVVGRTLPSFVLGVVTCAIANGLLEYIRTNFVASVAVSIDMNPGRPGWARLVLNNPDAADVRVALDGRLVPVTEAARLAPPGVSDVASWLEENFQAFPFGTPAHIAIRWQFVEFMILVGAATLLLLVAVVVVSRRRPV